MKHIQIIVTIVFIVTINIQKLYGQYSDSIGISYLYKSIIIFDENIKSITPGSKLMETSISEDKKSVFLVSDANIIKQLKPNIPPTNLLIITEKGYYNFFIYYKKNPTRQIIKAQNPIHTNTNDEKEKITIIKKEEKKKNNIKEKLKSLENLEEKTIYGGYYSRVYLFFAVTNIWVDQNNLYIKVKAENKNSTPYKIDYIHFFQRDKKIGSSRKNTPREKELYPINKLNEIKQNINKGEVYTNIFIFKKFTLYEKQRLYVQIGEVNGGRKAELFITRKEMLMINDGI